MSNKPKCKFKVGDTVQYKKLTNDYTGEKYRRTFSDGSLIQTIVKICFIKKLNRYDLWFNNDMWNTQDTVRNVVEKKCAA